MCHFVTAVLPRGADIDALRPIADAHSRRLEPLENRSVQAQLQQGEQYFLTTRASCDCGCALGARGGTGSHTALDAAAAARRRRLKGWSAARVARWIEQKEEALTRANEKHDTCVYSGAAEWVEFVRTTLSSGATPYIGLLLHWSSGPLSQRMKILERVVVPFSQINEDTILDAREDVLYIFQRDP